jgi:guanylate kinase
MEKKMRKAIISSGPSGSGKTTIAKHLLKKMRM